MKIVKVAGGLGNQMFQYAQAGASPCDMLFLSSLICLFSMETNPATLSAPFH